MRRSFTRLLLSLATLCAGIALAAHVMNVLAFDPGRSGRVLAAMLQTDEGKSLAADAISGQLQTLLPQVDQSKADAIGNRVARDPHLADVLEDGKDPMGAIASELSTIDPKLGRQASRALRTDGPHQAASSGGSGMTIPSVSDLLTSGGDTSVWGQVHRRAEQTHRILHQIVTLAFFGALALAGLALLIGPRRDLLVRRIGKWLVATSLTGFVLWVLVPHVLLPRLGGRWPVVAAAGLDAAGTGLVLLFTALMVTGLAALLASGLGSLLVPLLTTRDVPIELRDEARRRGRERSAWKQQVLAAHRSPNAPAPSSTDSRSTRDTSARDAARPRRPAMFPDTRRSGRW